MPSAPTSRQPKTLKQPYVAPTVDLSAVIMAATPDEPRVLTIRATPQHLEGLPSGPLQSQHRTLEMGLRTWVAEQTQLTLGYVEQLYTFGDRDRAEADVEGVGHSLSIAYLALVREARPAGLAHAAWRNWYSYLPWEDWREGCPQALKAIEPALKAWARTGGKSLKTFREERIELTFGFESGTWTDERVLERYELLFEAGLVPEAVRDAQPPVSAKVRLAPGKPMALDHRRILATAIGRLRGKIKYRPVIFELMPSSFTLLDLQKTVEALSGVRLHKQNFRRLVEMQGLVEETGEISSETGGRPARLVRFRREVLVERPAPGVRLPRLR
ncbi:NrtR DNA-binding winged helix domain-containing protein (plasmid) [Microvirga sp. RSM25]|uniref:NUDIX hydrolase n=1 Tax=Microvirga sp. RSM25 TaxID=3273802 RepID=UPI00384E950D